MKITGQKVNHAKLTKITKIDFVKENKRKGKRELIWCARGTDLHSEGESTFLPDYYKHWVKEKEKERLEGVDKETQKGKRDLPTRANGTRRVNDSNQFMSIPDFKT